MKYKCGHEPKPVIMDNNVLSYIFYEEWRKSKGFDGDNSMCFPCYCKENKLKEYKLEKKKCDEIKKLFLDSITEDV